VRHLLHGRGKVSMKIKDALLTKVPLEVNVTVDSTEASKRVNSDSSNKTVADSVSLQRPGLTSTSTANDVRLRASSAVSAVTLADEATNSIGSLVSSIEGILEQATIPGISNQRLSVLESEANQLVKAIKLQANQSTDQGVKPLSGDKIRLEVEKELGKTLEFLLPEGATDAFGIGKIQFSPKEAILQTRTTIAEVRQSIERLRSAVDGVQTAVRSNVTALDVALQNREASNTSIRDLDQALKITGQTRQEINRDPKTAIDSFSPKQSGILGLLR